MMKNENRMYQISCPNCHHEWSYNRNYYTQKIKQLGQEINDINNQIFVNKNTLSEKKKRDMVKAKNIKLRQLAEIKGIRAQYDIETNRNIYDFFKALVKEEIGEKRYMELIEKADVEARAYNVYSTAKTIYTGRGGKNIISINKL